MNRLSPLSNPLLLGFDEFERTLERISKASWDGYPPYNIERTGDTRLRITLAVAGFSRDDLDIQLEDNQLTVSGRQAVEDDRVYLHRGIAERNFERRFSLADHVRVTEARLGPQGVPSGVHGVEYFDDFVSTLTSYIGS